MVSPPTLHLLPVAAAHAVLRLAVLRLHKGTSEIPKWHRQAHRLAYWSASQGFRRSFRWVTGQLGPHFFRTFKCQPNPTILWCNLLKMSTVIEKSLWMKQMKFLSRFYFDFHRRALTRVITLPSYFHLWWQREILEIHITNTWPPLCFLWLKWPTKGPPPT